MKIIKSFFPFFLLLIIGVITFRFLFFISYIQEQKFDFRQQLISETNLKVIEVEFSNEDLYKNKNGFEWKEENKELVIDGVYYEVVSVKINKDHAVVSVINDKAENTLFKKFFCANKGIHKDFSDLIKLLLNLTYFGDNTPIQIKSFSKEIVNTYRFYYQFSDSEFLLKQIKPPQFS
jgi:hypothetical protein